MPTADHVRALIQAELPDAAIDVSDYTGTGDHFDVRVVSPAFSGRSRVEQHRMVYAAVSDGLADGSIHALKLKTSTP